MSKLVFVVVSYFDMLFIQLITDGNGAYEQLWNTVQKEWELELNISLG